MFRKFTVILCLLSFCPAAVGAQELAAIANSQSATDQSPTQKLHDKELNLSLPSREYPADKVVVAENKNSGDAVNAGEVKKEKKSGITFKEWAEIHWGDYRWVWWAGAAGALVALHALVFVDHK